MPKILLFDIETFPTVIESWEVYEASYLRILRPTTIAAFCAKWLDSKQHITRALCDYPGYHPVKAPRYGPVNDRLIVKDIWKLLDEADIVIAHNGDRFDIRKVNARFETYGMPPPSPYQTIDTLKEGRKVFGFDSQRLDERGKQLGIGGKEDNGGKRTWEGCLDGDMQKWRRMKKYVTRDVLLLEKIYKIDRPWMKKHPNIGNYVDASMRCPKCGSGRLQSRGKRIAVAAKYHQYQCQDCGAWSRGYQNIQDIKVTRL